MAKLNDEVQTTTKLNRKNKIDYLKQIKYTIDQQTRR